MLVQGGTSSILPQGLCGMPSFLMTEQQSYPGLSGFQGSKRGDAGGLGNGTGSGASWESQVAKAPFKQGLPHGQKGSWPPPRCLIPSLKRHCLPCWVSLRELW